MSQSKYPYEEFSGALQEKSTTHIKKPNEVRKAVNADFSTVLGAMRRRPGAQATVVSYPKLPVDAPALGAYIANFPTAVELWAAQNDTASSPTQSKLYRNTTGSSWTAMVSSLPVSAEIDMFDDNEEVWVSVYDPINDVIGNSFTIDSTHNVSYDRQLAYGPEARFFVEFAGSIWAGDVLIGATRYRDRVYKSSGPTGAVTFVRAAQTDLLSTFQLVDQVPVMTSNTTPTGTASASTVTTGNIAWQAFTQAAVTLADKWLSASGSVTNQTIGYDFGSGITRVITHYSLVGIAALDSANATRAPKTFSLQGSNNGSTWTTLDTRTNVAAWTGGEKRVYATSNTTAYRYYQLLVASNQGDTSFISVSNLQFLSTPSNSSLMELDVDSARYLKAGMVLDIYTAGTNTLVNTITVNDVDKINDTITFLPNYQAFATTDVNTTTDVITLPNASQFVTGAPIIFDSSSAVPTGLSAGITYYAINVSSTTIKVATTALNASLGVAIDITAVGSGTQRVRLSYVFGNKDEVWKNGRKGTLTRFWNTDYRNPEASDYIKLPATPDAKNALTGLGSISNRLFMFTANSVIKFDGQNLNPLRKGVGCIAHRTIAYYDNYMIWLDAKGQIWARNEEAGTQDIISLPIATTMAGIPQSQLPAATAVCVDDSYKLYLGANSAGQNVRVVYNFRTNQWVTETWTPQMPVQLEYKYSGTIKPHFFDEKGQLWVDEQGTDDDGAAIPMDVELGDDNLTVDEVKSFVGIKVYGKSITATKVYCSVDGGKWIEVGQLTQRIQSLAFPKEVPNGTNINFRFESSYVGDTPQIDHATVWFNKEEDTFRATIVR